MHEGIKKIGKDSAWYFGSNVVYVILGFIALPVLTRVLSKREYGIYSLIVVTIGFAAIMLSWLSAGTIRYYAEHEKSNQIGVFYSTILHFLPHFTIIVIAIGLPLTLFLPLGNNRNLAILCIFIYILSSFLYVELAILRARRQVAFYSIGFLADPLGRFVLGILLFTVFGMGLMGIFWGWLIALAIVAPVCFVALAVPKYYRRRDYSPELLKSILRYGLPLSASYIMFWVLRVSDRYVIGLIKGAAQVGLYAMIYNLTQQVFSVLFTAIVMGGEPVIFQTFENEGEEKTQNLITLLTRYFLILIIPVAVAFIILQVRIVHVLVGPQFYSAHNATIPLVIGFCAERLSWFAVMVFALKKKTKNLLLIATVAAAANLVLNFIFVPIFGYVAAAFTTMFSYFLYLGMVVTFSRKYLKWVFPWKSLFRILVASAGMSAVLVFLNMFIFEGIWGLLIIIVAGTVTYFVCLLLVRELHRSEVRTVIMYIKKKLAVFIPWIDVE